ncbi:MAG: hypothetical protein IJZ68_08090 [Bacteroidaceae bacterium]|nr:hypothetical protein [Bacteroidaceae bacterium]
MQEFKKATTAVIDTIGVDNRLWVPYIKADEFSNVSKHMTRAEWRALSAEQKKDLFPRDFGNVDAKDIDAARSWARGVFQHRYTYDNERQLLCMFSVHDAVHSIFDGTVYFQNSTDQNYARSEYAGISAFEAIFDKWQSMPEADFLKWYREKNGSSFYDDYEIGCYQGEEREQRYLQKMEYARSTAAYAEIWSNYESTLYNDESAVYISLYGPYDIQPLTCFLKAAHDAEVEARDENDIVYFKTLVGQNPEWKTTLERMCRHELDVVKEMDSFMKLHPDFLERYPEYREAYDAFMKEHANDTPEVPEHTDEEVK